MHARNLHSCIRLASEGPSGDLDFRPMAEEMAPQKKDKAPGQKSLESFDAPISAEPSEKDLFAPSAQPVQQLATVVAKGPAPISFDTHSPVPFGQSDSESQTADSGVSLEIGEAGAFTSQSIDFGSRTQGELSESKTSEDSTVVDVNMSGDPFKETAETNGDVALAVTSPSEREQFLADVFALAKDQGEQQAQQNGEYSGNDAGVSVEVNLTGDHYESRSGVPQPPEPSREPAREAARESSRESARESARAPAQASHGRPPQIEPQIQAEPPAEAFDFGPNPRLDFMDGEKLLEQDSLVQLPASAPIPPMQPALQVPLKGTQEQEKKSGPDKGSPSNANESPPVAVEGATQTRFTQIGTLKEVGSKKKREPAPDQSGLRKVIRTALMLLIAFLGLGTVGLTFYAEDPAVVAFLSELTGLDLGATPSAAEETLAGKSGQQGASQGTPQKASKKISKKDSKNMAKSAQKSPLRKAKTGALAAAPATAPLPKDIRDEVKDESRDESAKKSALEVVNLGPNAPYFEGIEQALVIGDVQKTMQLLSVPMSSPFTTGPQKMVGDLVKGRFQLLAGAHEKAVTSLLRACPKVGVGTRLSCVHLVRAFIASRQFPAAGKLLAQLTAHSQDAPQAENELSDVVKVLNLALGALERPNLKGAMALLESFTEGLDLSNEWYRQRSIWIVQSIVALSEGDRRTIATLVFNTKRDLFQSTLANADALLNSGIDPLLAPYLANLAFEFEKQALTQPSGRVRFENEPSAVAQVLGLVNRAYIEPSDNIIALGAPLGGRGVYGEILRLLAVNMALQDGNLSAAQAGLTSRTPVSGLLQVEWAIARARFACQLDSSAEAWQAALGRLEALAKLEPRLGRDPHVWLVRARLLRLLRLPVRAREALNQARVLAVMPREQGLVVVEDAFQLRTEGLVAQGFRKVSAGVAKIGFHGPLLEAAAELAGHSGADPSPFIDKQALVPPAFVRRSQDVPPLSSFTMRIIIESL